MQLFYQPNILPQDIEVVFSREESKHIVRVLRKKEGDLLFLTNGKGHLFKTEITVASQNACISRIISSEETEIPNYHLHLAIAPTKMNDRYETFLEKATEIGVHEITPLICDNSERKIIKLNRFERVLQSAMKQSLQTRLPVLNKPVPFSEFVQKEIPGQKFIAHCEDESEKKPLLAQLRNKPEITKTTILIGPEGDFSPSEIKTVLKYDWKAISLGSNRLRTETAAIVACHTVALVQGV
ncbi:MAG TPA: 16S rRNA (uracil(1498)-N(3))-methyltransferase [Salinimicrobium sp.]|nr:16S rRNA (uracil(1498)-N(3))-methyltransferase [Salinimicrobium sp.]